MPKISSLVSLGIAWAVIAASFAVILGGTVASACGMSHIEALCYIQKLMLITGIAIIVQILAGHKLPAMFGPSAILLVAALVSLSSGPNAFYTAMILCAALCAVISWTPVLKFVQKLFTPRVTAAVLLLISVCTLPTIIHLLFNPAEPGGFIPKLIFTLVMLLFMFLCGRFLRGWFKATMYLWALILGGLAAGLVFGFGDVVLHPFGFYAFDGGFITPVFSLAVLIPTLIAYLALMANEFGSVYSVSEIIGVKVPEKTMRRTMTVTSLINAVSGGCGVIGGINYSTSTGIILDTRNASKYPIFAGGVLVIILGLLSPVLELLMCIPSIVTGCLLLYIMALQASASLNLLHAQPLGTNSGLIVGFTLLCGIVFSFLPAEVLAGVPTVLLPCVSSGFVIGTVMLLILEHVIFRGK